MSNGSPLPHPQDEDELILLALKGDGEAFGELYVRHLDAIYRYVYFKIGDPVEAEDLTEEVFVRAWEALPGYQKREARFTSWLYRIAHNLTIDYRRRKRPVTLADQEEHPAWATVPSPEEIVERGQLIRALAAAVTQLNDEEQQVLILRYVEGLPHEEVAEIIGKSNEASRIIQHRALGKLNGLMKR